MPASPQERPVSGLPESLAVQQVERPGQQVPPREVRSAPQVSRLRVQSRCALVPSGRAEQPDASQVQAVPPDAQWLDARLPMAVGEYVREQVSARASPVAASAAPSPVRVRLCPAADGELFRLPRAEWNWSASFFRLRQDPAKGQ